MSDQEATNYWLNDKTRSMAKKRYTLNGKEYPDEASYNAALSAAIAPPAVPPVTRGAALTIAPGDAKFPDGGRMTALPGLGGPGYTPPITLPNPSGGPLVLIPQTRAEPPPNFPVDEIRQGMGEASTNRIDALASQPNAFDLQRAQSEAKAAGATAALREVPAIDPNAKRYNPDIYNPQTYAPTPYQPGEYHPQELPTHALQTIPTRPAPQVDPAASILAAIGGLVDPSAAGHFAAAPLRATQQYADTAFADAIQRYHLQQQQNDTAYRDAAANVQQGNQAQQFNVGQGNEAGRYNATQASEASRLNTGEANRAQEFNIGQAVAGDTRRFNDALAISHERVPLAMTIGENGVMGPDLETMSQNLHASQLSEQKAKEAEANTGLIRAAYEDAYNKWKTEGSLEAMVKKETLRMNYQLMALQERYHRDAMQYPVGADGLPVSGNKGRSMAPGTRADLMKFYLQHPELDPRVYGDKQLNAAVDDARRGGYQDPKTQAQYSGDEFDVRVKGYQDRYIAAEKRVSKIVDEEEKNFANISRSDRQRLEYQYYNGDDGNIPPGQPTSGPAFEAWARQRWLSVMNPRVSVAFETILNPAKKARDEAVEKLKTSPHTPGAAGSNSAPPPTNTPKKNKAFNPATGKIE